MVSRGLIIKECPSKQINASNIMNDTDIDDDVPLPDEDDDHSSENGRTKLD